jgi:hypothetical protein
MSHILFRFKDLAMEHPNDLHQFIQQVMSLEPKSIKMKKITSEILTVIDSCSKIS